MDIMTRKRKNQNNFSDKDMNFSQGFCYFCCFDMLQLLIFLSFIMFSASPCAWINISDHQGMPYY